jgi:hypothetical protein
MTGGTLQLINGMYPRVSYAYLVQGTDVFALANQILTALE